MIQLLEQETIDKIAAGEVIERPVAVVKELVENAIDSGANAVTVEIKNGGITFIRITDNGCGISREELPSAFLRHATSKIKTIEDLFTVKSLGFRGEALSSIAAVSQVECITKTRDSLQGCRYEIHGGNEKEREEIGCPDGTTFIVRNLFYNTPARQKFLKTKTTEGNYINEWMERFSLSHPEISFRFISDGNTKLQTSGNSNCKNNIYYIYGSDITKALLEINTCQNDMELTGFVAKPEVSRGTRVYMNYFINGRYIKSPVISRAIEDAYKGYMMGHRYPFTTLFLTIDSHLIDVNVHPTKMEIRFQNQEEVYQIFYEAIKSALAKPSLIPEVTLDKAITTVSEKKVGAKEEPHMPEPFEEKRRTEFIQEYKVEQPKPVVRESVPFQYEQVNMLDQSPELEEEQKANFRIIGQVFATYWLIEYENQLLIIDQHAAHEKVLYEKMIKSVENSEILSQPLVVPVVVTLSPTEVETLKTYSDTLCRLGFEAEPFGGHEYAIKAVPSDFLKLDVKELFIDLLDHLMEKGGGDSEMILERVASMSCKAAVKGNHTFSLFEAQKLIEQMLLLDNPYHCPHGRPTTITMTKTEFEKKFKRIL